MVKERLLIGLVLSLLIVGFLVGIFFVKTSYPGSLPQNVVFKDNCDKLGEQVRGLINEANYCYTPSDCVISSEFWCPFGCYNLFNKNADLKLIREGFEKYKKNCQLCEYDCAIVPESKDIKCKNGKCIDVRFEV